MAVDFKVVCRILAVATAALSVIVLPGCTRGESNVAEGNRRGVLHLGNGSEPQTIDPHVMSGSPEVTIARALYEGLVTRNPYTLEIEPGVAQRWEISDDGRVMTFHLNPAARWSNGDPVTAADFAWSLRRSLHPDMGNALAYTLFRIEGAEAFARGELADPGMLGVRALDTHTLQISLTHPDPYFLGALSTYPTYPVHRATVEAHGRFTDRFTRWTRAENFVGNGPFTLKEWKINRRLVVIRSDTYWDADRVALNAIVFHPIENETAEEKMFRAGQLHYTYHMPINKIPAYQIMDDSPYRQAPWQGTYLLQLNTKRPPLDDPRVRRALAMAIDREQLVGTVLLGTELASSTLVPAATPGYTSAESIHYDPGQARALLAEAGFPGGQGWPGLEYLYNTSENNRIVAIALQQMWKDQLNVDVSLVNQEWKVYLDTVRQNNYTLSRRGWIAANLNPNSFLSPYTSLNGNNNTGFSNTRFDQIILKLAPETAEPAVRLSLLQEAETLLLQSAAVIPLYTYNSKHLVQPGLEGAPGNVLDILNFKYISLDPNAPAWTGRN